MQVLPLFLLLPLGGRGKVGVLRASVAHLYHSQRCQISATKIIKNGTYQVVEGEVAEISRLDAEVLEGLSGGINLLVNEFPLDLIRRESVPPEEPIEPVGGRLQNGLRDVDVTAVLDDLTVHELSDLSCGVVLRTVKLEGRRGGRVIVQHALQSVANIDSL